MIDFPANPTVGQQFTSGGVTWTWDGVKWTASGLNVAYLPLTGGTLTGNLKSEAATGVVQYTQVGHDNAVYPANILQRTRGTQAAPTILATSDVTGAIHFYGYDSATMRSTCSIQSYVTEPTPSTTAFGGALRIMTAPLGTNSVVTSAFFDGTGLTMAGARDITLNRDPTNALHATTKQYVDAGNAARLPLAGGTMTGPITGIPSGFRVDGAAGTARTAMIGRTAGSNRWDIVLGNGVAESGGNVGSDFRIDAYADDGATIVAQPIIITRSTGQVTIPNLNAPGVIGDNRIINGDMRIDQRNNGASGTASGYTIDRWQYISSTTGKGTWQRATGGAGLLQQGFGYYLSFASSSAYVAPGSEQYCWFQIIEADLIADFAWGTSGAQPVTLSFLAYSSLTGTFSGAIANQPNPPTRSCPFSFSIPVANTWTKISVTIPGDTAGTWVLQGNGAGACVKFDLGSGPGLKGPAGVWASANYAGVTGAVSVIATNAASLFVTGVKLEVGSVATPYNRQSLAKSMIDCQRYYQTYTLLGATSYAAAGGSFWTSFLYPVQMRAVPTATVTPASYTNCSAGTILPTTIDYSYLRATATAIGAATWSASPITLSAEL